MIQLPDELGLILGLALLALVPFIAVMATSFIKMTVVFSLLRNALGVQQIPPNMAMYGLAIILSLYVMAPVGFATRDYLRNHDVSLSDSASVERFLDEGMAPYRNFLKRQIQEREHTFFMESTRQVWPSEYAERLDPDSLLILLPAWQGLVQIKQYPLGNWLIMAVMVLVWGADIGAYFSGRAFGKRKLAPQVSPGKSWEGVYGGLALSLVITAIVGLVRDWTVAELLKGLVGAALIVFISVVGDLTESMFKRQSGIKDSSNLLPGHGGVLDRIDSLTAAIPIFAVLLWMAAP